VRVCVCVYVCVSIYLCVHTRTHTNTHMYTCICRYIYLYIYIPAPLGHVEEFVRVAFGSVQVDLCREVVSHKCQKRPRNRPIQCHKRPIDTEYLCREAGLAYDMYPPPHLRVSSVIGDLVTLQTCAGGLVLVLASSHKRPRNRPIKCHKTDLLSVKRDLRTLDTCAGRLVLVLASLNMSCGATCEYLRSAQVSRDLI
jgi:hypothetical protein